MEMDSFAWVSLWRQTRFSDRFFYPLCWNLQACDAWKKEAEEANDRANTANMECELAREQREALELQVKKLQEELERIHTGQDPQFLRSFSDLETLSLSSLYTLQKQLRANLEKVDKVSARAWQGRALHSLLLQVTAFPLVFNRPRNQKPIRAFPGRCNQSEL